MFFAYSLTSVVIMFLDIFRLWLLLDAVRIFLILDSEGELGVYPYVRLVGFNMELTPWKDGLRVMINLEGGYLPIYRIELDN